MRFETPEPEERELVEVTLSQLNHQASAIVRKVERRGSVAVVSRHGKAVAILLPFPEAIEWLPSWFFGEGRSAELGAEFERRARDRADSARMHGRWWRPDGAG